MKREGEALKISQMALKSTPYEYKLRKYKARKIQKEEEEKREIDDLEAFVTYYSSRRSDEKEGAQTQNVVLRRHIRKKRLEYIMKKNVIKAEKAPEQKKEDLGMYMLEVKPVKEEKEKIMYTFDVVQWEKNIDQNNLQGNIESRLLLDQDFDIVKWEESIVYDDKTFTTDRIHTHLVIDANDKNLLFDIIEKDQQKEKKNKKRRNTSTKGLTGKYNISGDKSYIDTDKTLKSALSMQGVQHSIPALKLAPEIYRTHLTKEELRFFHRPQLHLSPLSEITFSPLIESTTKPSSILKKKKELTLRDTTEFVLLEYSEEIPPLIANTGMASIITTFYRKSSSKDMPLIEPDIGTVTILDPKDPSPFMFIGDVYPKESISAIINNLFKAPIFFHQTEDLLAIRVKEEKNVYYLRPIKKLACVGQTLPVEEAFSPHSRKYNIFCKNRLKVAAYRMFYKKGNKDRSMYIQQLDAMFPHFSEGSKRKWLKEYAECIKKGKDNIWVLKPTSSLLSEEDLRRIVTPEQVCQYESMLAEERRLKDAGIILAATEEEGGEEEELKMTVWNCTRNFVNAVAGKGMLEISGSGDPTGIGEGFSFVRVRKKDKEGEEEGEKEKKTTSEQMQAYKDEIKEIWDKQLASLRNTVPPPRPEKDSKISRPAPRRSVLQEPKPEKVLSITRTIAKGDKRVQETEIVTDARVIDAYLKARKQQRREESRTSLRCGSCGQIGHMKTNKSCMNYKGKATGRKEKKKSHLAMLSEIILSVVKELFSVPFSIAFHRPVSVKKFPNYLEFISNPIDLTTIKTKARNEQYKRYEEFLNDIKLMSSNCNTYNGPGHSLTKISNEMVEMAQAALENNKEAISLLEKREDISPS